MSIELIADGIIDLIKKNLIAETDLTSDVSPGDETIFVYNAYRFHADEEIVIIDYGYNQTGNVHHKVMEYARVKSIDSTTSITLYDPAQGAWTVAANSFIQKTIGHSPLYSDNIFYGDREVIAPNDIAITIEPTSLNNEWIYIRGGLSEEYRIRIMIYGKSIKTDEGRRILDRYSWAVYSLLNSNIHIDATDIETPLVNDYVVGSNQLVIEDTSENRENFIVSVSYDIATRYKMQDNLGTTCWFNITNRVIGGGLIHLTINRTFTDTYLLSEFAVLRRGGIYVYDSRVDSITYGQVSKGSAFLRAAELNWFGKKVNEQFFPQTSDGVDNFDRIPEASSSSSSSSSFDSSSSSS